MPLLRNPNYEPWKKKVFWQARWKGHEGILTGHTIRDSKFRYSEWIENTNGPPRVWPEPIAKELYDKVSDPGENYNLANDTKYDDVMLDLSAQLHDGWRAAIV